MLDCDGFWWSEIGGLSQLAVCGSQQTTQNRTTNNDSAEVWRWFVKLQKSKEEKEWCLNGDGGVGATVIHPPVNVPRFSLGFGL